MIERTQVQRNRISELVLGSRRIKLTEDILRKQDKVVLIMTDGREVKEELTIDTKVLKMARGYVHGVFNEMMADGQAEDIQEILRYGKRKNNQPNPK